ncbi:hypothetical protein Ancab_007495 [Ancistrocladus abbreviatus]
MQWNPHSQRWERAERRERWGVGGSAARQVLMSCRVLIITGEWDSVVIIPSSTKRSKNPGGKLTLDSRAVQSRGSSEPKKPKKSNHNITEKLDIITTPEAESPPPEAIPSPTLKSSPEVGSDVMVTDTQDRAVSEAGCLAKVHPILMDFVGKNQAVMIMKGKSRGKGEQRVVNGVELRRVPSGPDPLHHNVGPPKKPRSSP